MNEMTTNFFKTIEDTSDGGFQKIKTIWNMSKQAEAVGLPQLTVDSNVLIRNDKGEKFSLLAYAIKQNNIQAIDFLLENRIDVNLGEPTPLICAVQQKNTKLVKCLTEVTGIDINKGSPKSPLCYAIEDNNQELVLWLIEKGADTNAGEITPLWCAIYQDNIETASLLLDSGANANKYSEKKIQVKFIAGRHNWRNEVTQKSINQVVTPIYEAGAKGNKEMINLLLLNDADASLNPINKEKDISEICDGDNKVILQDNLDFILTTEQILTNSPPDLKLNCKEILRNNHLRPPVITLEEKCRDYKPISKTTLCVQKLNAAKKAFDKKYTTQIFRDLCDAYELDGEFFIDYIARKIHKINHKIYHEQSDPKYLISFIGTFNFLLREASMSSKNFELCEYFEKVILELTGYDPEAEDQPIKLFNTREEKMKFIDQVRISDLWENSLKTMKGSTSNANASEQTNTKKINIPTPNNSNDNNISSFNTSSNFYKPENESLPNTNNNNVDTVNNNSPVFGNKNQS